MTKTCVGLTPKLLGRHSFDLKKSPIKIGNIVKSYVVTHVSDVAVSLHQELTSPVDSEPIHEISKGIPCRASEITRKLAFSHSYTLTNIRHGELFSAVLSDVFDDVVDFIE